MFAKGALFSTGDGHFAQGDGEVCVTAVEMGATVAVRFKVHKDLARKRTFAGPVFSHNGYFADPAFAVPENFLGVMGMPINAEGEIESENLTLACRNAILNMMSLLQERGFQPRAGLCHLQCRGRSAHLQRGRCAELRRVSTAAGGDLRRRLNCRA